MRTFPQTAPLKAATTAPQMSQSTTVSPSVPNHKDYNLIGFGNPNCSCKPLAFISVRWDGIRQMGYGGYGNPFPACKALYDFRSVYSQETD